MSRWLLWRSFTTQVNFAEFFRCSAAQFDVRREWQRISE